MSGHLREIAADLQTHSTCSDGTDTPAELVQKAAQQGLRAIALTDHDSILGVEEALAAGREHGVEVVPALEFSTQQEPERGLIDIDVLGYWINPSDPGLRDTLERVMAARREQKIAQIKRLQEHGIEISVEEVLALAGGVPGRPHIAEVVWRRNPGRFRSKQEIFDQLLSPRSPTYVPRSFSLTVKQAIEVILAAGGLPVLAHPGFYTHIQDIERVIRQLQEAGLRGIEVWYPYRQVHGEEISAAQAKAMVKQFQRLAAKLHLLATGGSDYHGQRTPHIRLGECGMTWEDYQALRETARQGI